MARFSKQRSVVGKEQQGEGPIPGLTLSARLKIVPCYKCDLQAVTFCPGDKAAFKDILDAVERALNVFP